ncbi:putative lipid II flippase FtsW [Salisediminibacterium halotolerans]|uniref:Probable peptidoglycan glycosyltransferase FtsW n=1 Tax=Salisediminibacterium halotolerans TaxID=517425 RepID=A0A1H9UXP8_9BACI|nr:putative lipid II flippase FtsW [Salisediminibacterium haloalkalitolerans]SES14119.1 cell division protein FtsW [Salisediminibacterium haloalkalitolerans]
MEGSEKRKLYIDRYLLTAIAVLSIFGLIMIYSASYVRGYEQFGNMTHFFDRQLMWLFLSTLMLIFFMFFPYRHYSKMIKFILIGSFAMLVLVLMPGIGYEVNHATRWVTVGGFQIQPSEFVKISMIIYIAYVYSRKQAYIDKFVSGLLPPLIIVVLMFALILMQPDLGTATSIVLVAGMLAFCSGARFFHIFSLGGLAGYAIYHYATSAPYRMNRITGHMNPFEMEADHGFQLVQSYIAIAHGGMSGAGIGQSVQKLFYLPEAHTDFILAIVSEELGVIGIGFVFLLISVIIFRGILVGMRCRDAFGSLLAYGIVFQLAIQIVFNAGAVNGLLPITGIPFPFLSYGGSSIMVTFISMGILINISRRTEKDRQERRGETESVPVYENENRSFYAGSK